MASMIETTVSKMEMASLRDEKPTRPTSTPQEPSKRQVEHVVELLKNIEANNGYVGVAQKSGVKVAVVKQIHARVRQRIAELSVDDDPIDVEPKPEPKPIDEPKVRK